MIATSIRQTSVTIVLNNDVYTVEKTNPNWNNVLDAIRNNDEYELKRLLDEKTVISEYTEGNVTVKHGDIFFKGAKLGGTLIERIREFIKQKLPVVPLLKFLNKLMENPSRRAVTELYKFLENQNMPITPDGNFLAYKGLDGSFWSKTANKETVVLKGKTDTQGRIFNGVGETIEVTRNSVCDDPNQGCASGIHAGSLKYAQSFASGGKLVIVEINPADVVSVPNESSEKLRTCKYVVKCEYKQPLNNHYQA